MAKPLSLVLVGTDGNHRQKLLRECIDGDKRFRCHHVDYREFAECAGTSLDEKFDGSIVRLDSPEHSLDLEKMLLERGFHENHSTACERIGPGEIRTLGINRGELRYPTQYFLGFRSLLKSLAVAKELGSAKAWLTCPREIAEIFDKAELYLTYEKLGVPQPDTRVEIKTFDEVFEYAGLHQSTGVYLKHRFGSTGSGMLYIRRINQNLYSWSTFAFQRGKKINLLKPFASRDLAEIKSMINYLLDEGAVLQVGIKKARVNGFPFDCRFVVIDQRVSFIIVRKSSSPFTNLNLGGERDVFEALRRTIPDRIIKEAIRCCIKIARHHMQFMIGVDVVFDANKENFYILESNAFGGFFPNLYRKGLSVLMWELDAIYERYAAG